MIYGITETPLVPQKRLKIAENARNVHSSENFTKNRFFENAEHAAPILRGMRHRGCAAAAAAPRPLPRRCGLRGHDHHHGRGRGRGGGRGREGRNGAAAAVARPRLPRSRGAASPSKLVLRVLHFQKIDFL